MIFLNKKHEDFYYNCLVETKKIDGYYKALFYLLGIHEETRKRIKEIYDFKKEHIHIDVLEKPWQTASTYRACLLAFNLFNGYVDNMAIESTPHGLFCDPNAEYYFEAIKLRYPQYMSQRVYDYERY